MTDASIPTLQPGSVVLKRFEVAEFAHEDALGALYRAKDQKTQRAIALRVFRPEHLTDDVKRALRTSVRAATKVRHPNIASTFGIGTDSVTGATVAAFEWVEGKTLTALLAARAGKPISLKGAAQLMDMICDALEAAEEHGLGAPHGALRPDAVWIAQNGTVKISEFGMASTIIATLGPSVLPPAEQTCLAPEVKAGGAASLQSDVFSVGAILYQLLTGRSTAQGFVPPSQAHPDATADIDTWLLKCLAPDPANRFAIFDALRESLEDLVEHAPDAPPGGDFGMLLKTGSTGRASRAPAARAAAPAAASTSAQAAPASPAPGAPAASAPQVGARVSMHEDFRPTGDPFAVAKVANTGAPVAAPVDLGAMLASITENDSHRWIAVKDGLDHGPFSGRELVRMIAAGEVSETHAVMNMDTGERKPVKEWPEFAEFAAQHRAKVKQEATAAAVEQAEDTEKKVGRTKVFVAAALILLVVGGGAAFAMTRTGGSDGPSARADLDGLYEMGEIEIRGTAESLPETPHGGRHGGRRHAQSGSHASGSGAGASDDSGGAGLSYEEAMNRAVEMGDISGGGRGGGQLTSSQVAAVMNQNVNRVYARCVVPEQGRGGNLNAVTIDIAILGSGQVQGASARVGSREFKACVNRTVRGVRFPSFGAPRMGARYTFNAR